MEIIQSFLIIFISLFLSQLLNGLIFLILKADKYENELSVKIAKAVSDHLKNNYK